MTVTKTGDGSVNGSATFQVKQWELTFSKTETNSNFEYGYSTFGNTTVYFRADVTDLTNGTTVTGLENNFTVRLANYLGTVIANATVSYNSSLSDYLFNLTTPAVLGTYTLGVSVFYEGEMQTSERTITVANTSATATSTDVTGAKKDIFTISEFLYLKITSKNATAESNATDAEIISIKYEDGTQMNYTNTTSCSSMNLTDNALQWCWLQNSSMIKIDPPKTGGLYTLELYANNRSATATGRFMVKPYSVCASAKASENTQTSDYYWQFKTTDIIYFLATVVQMSDTSSLSAANFTQNTMGEASGMYYGRGSACSIGSTQSAVENANITINRVVNIQTGKTETLNSTSSVCKSITYSSKPAYMCTLQPNDSKWDGGKYYVVLDVTSSDGATRDKGYGMFEAKSFYLNGWSSTWQNRPNASIMFNLYMYSGGGGWWSGSGGGLSGSVTLEKVVYLGNSYGGG